MNAVTRKGLPLAAIDQINGFLFPRSTFVDLMTLKTQIEKVESEVFEVHQLLGKKTVRLDRVADEVEDAIQALESLRRMLLEKHNVNVYAARSRVIKKNHRRGYYQ